MKCSVRLFLYLGKAWSLLEEINFLNYLCYALSNLDLSTSLRGIVTFLLQMTSMRDTESVHVELALGVLGT